MYWVERLTSVASAVVTVWHKLYTCISPTGYQCFLLTPGSRKRLLEKFPPKFSHVEADHITHEYGTTLSATLPPVPHVIEVVGYACDDSLECVAVTIDGQLRRTDGHIYHITLSREPNRRPKQSNELVENSREPAGKLFLAGEPHFRIIRKK